MENLLAFLLAVAVLQVKADVSYKLFDYNAEALETAVKEKAHLVLLYANADLCQECEKVRTTVHELMGKYNSVEDRSVTVAELDCSANTDFCTKLDVKTYPEFYFFPLGGGKNIKYVGDVKKEDIETFMQEQSAAGAASKLTVEPKNGLYELTQGSFKSFVAEGHHFIKFYAPWCGHCKKLAPTWDDLAKGFENSEDVKISKIDCTAHTEVCRDHGIRGYPTLKFFSAGEDIESYKGPRSHDELKKFVTEQVQKRNAPPQEAPAADSTTESAKEAVRELTDQDFADVIGSGVTFVKFYAPWCGHCKRLAPTWEELGKEVSSVSGVSVAKIDCTKYKEVCSEHEVRGYPTLYLFRDGERKPKYSGGRDLASLKAYLSGEFKKDEL